MEIENVRKCHLIYLIVALCFFGIAFTLGELLAAALKTSIRSIDHYAFSYVGKIQPGWQRDWIVFIMGFAICLVFACFCVCILILDEHYMHIDKYAESKIS